MKLSEGKWTEKSHHNHREPRLNRLPTFRVTRDMIMTSRHLTASLHIGRSTADRDGYERVDVERMLSPNACKEI